LPKSSAGILQRKMILCCLNQILAAGIEPACAGFAARCDPYRPTKVVPVSGNTTGKVLTKADAI